MHRWFIAIALFLLSFICSLWIYIYAHKACYTQLALTHAYPSSLVSLGPVSIDCSLQSLLITWNDITIQPESSLEGDTALQVKALRADIPLSSFLSWALLPLKTPLYIDTIAIENSSAPRASEALYPPPLPSSLTMMVHHVRIQQKEAPEEERVVSPTTPLTLRELLDLARS